MKRTRYPAKSPGFTLIEIMLVVVIIGILASVIGPRLIGQSGKAKVSATKSSIKGIETALGLFEVKASRFPTTEEGLQALLTKPNDLKDDEWDGPYLKEILDSFGEEFIYREPGENGREYDVISKGKNKREGDDDDISNAPVESKR